MLTDVSFFDKNATLVSHITGRRAWVLVIMAVVLDGQSLGWGLPVATDGELLRVITRPDLDLIDVTIAETCILHGVCECLSITVGSFVAEKKIFLTTDKHFEVSHEIFWKITTTEIVLDLGEDGCE